ncbi:conserved hypothetical protein [Brugia malayi]|uniref:BMA-EPG-4, isoform a n=3 Tax=Brugia malayi TaxID=6279 RepID=A0A0H5S773_BRUMA|nr:uncharacterized protein BM_BM3893 [Brugia malayi]CRZ24019.1 BMA-EPG-4, isoform a [Brugia malayi]VIO92683.1 conserved hypothetical protein [Brugia malayi]
MGLPACICDYLYGLRDSLKSLFVIHKLDQISDGERRKMENKQRELLRPKMTTVLQQRRLASSAKEKRNVEMVAKPKAITGLMCSLILNMILISVLYVTMPKQTSTFLRLLHGLFCLSALIISRVCNSIWSSDIANASLKYTGVHTPSLSLSRTTGDFCSSMLLDFVFFLQSLFVSNIPVPLVSSVFTFIHMTLLNSLFSFEYLWMSLGIGLRARINLIERNWPYFLGYGTVLTLFTSLTDNMVLNAFLFGALFPFCIISSFLVEAGNYKQRSHPYVHIFGPSIATTNYITSGLSNLLKSIGCKTVQTSMVKKSNISLRDDHSRSPMRNMDLRTGHSGARSSTE